MSSTLVRPIERDPPVDDAELEADLSARLDALVAAVRWADLNSLSLRRRWRHVLFGADLHAADRYAAALRTCEDALAAARLAAGASAHRLGRDGAASPQSRARRIRLATDSAPAEAAPPITRHRQLLERFAAVEATLYPAWARGAFAMAKSSPSATGIAEARKAAHRLVERLTARLTTAAA